MNYLKILICLSLILTQQKKEVEKIIETCEPNNSNSIKIISQKTITESIVSYLLQYLETFIILNLKNNNDDKEDEKTISESSVLDLISIITQIKKDFHISRMHLIWPKIKGLIANIFENKKDKKDEHEKAVEFINNINIELLKQMDINSITKSVEYHNNFENIDYDLIKKIKTDEEYKKKVCEDIYAGKMLDFAKNLYIEDNFLDFLLDQKTTISSVEYNNLINFINLVEKNRDEKNIHEQLVKKNPNYIYLEDTLNYVHLALKFLNFCFNDYDKLKEIIDKFVNKNN